MLLLALVLCFCAHNADAKRRRHKNPDNEPEASLSNFIFKIMNVDSLKFLPTESDGPRLSNYNRKNYRNTARN